MEADYASTLLVPLPQGKTPLMHFDDIFRSELFHHMDMWATCECKLPRMKDTEIQLLGEAFDQAQLGDHQLDHATLKTDMLANLQLVS